MRTALRLNCPEREELEFLSFKSSAEWINYLVSQTIPGYGQELSRIEPLFKKLNLARLAPTIIVVTGTNGKGSVVKALEAIYLAAGYRVAAVTSPHITTIHERLTLNGEMVSEAQVLQAFAHIESCRDLNVPINYFDFIHLAWFYLIDRFKPEIAILEVGCGGRLDITNLLDADACVITSIDLDHTELLGATRELIAVEKAHLARRDCPVVCGEPDPPVTLWPFLQGRGSRLYCIHKDFDCAVTADGWDWHAGQAVLKGLAVPKIKLENAAIALEVIHVLQDKNPVSDAAIRQGLEHVSISGRFERVALPQCEIIYDVTHNPHAANWLATQLKQQPIAGKTYAVFGMLDRKDIVNTIKPLLPVIDVWYLSTLQQKDSYSATEIGEHLRALGHKNWYTNDILAIQLSELLRIVTQQDRIVVFGSFHAVHEAKRCVDGESE